MLQALCLIASWRICFLRYSGAPASFVPFYFFLHLSFLYFWSITMPRFVCWPVRKFDRSDRRATLPPIRGYYHWARCMALIVYARHCNLPVPWVEFTNAPIAGVRWRELQGREPGRLQKTRTQRFSFSRADSSARGSRNVSVSASSDWLIALVVCVDRGRGSSATG